MQVTDVEIHGAPGSITEFECHTERARIWVFDYCEIEPWQHAPAGFFCESNYARPIIEGMRESGLTVEL